MKLILQIHVNSPQYMETGILKAAVSETAEMLAEVNCNSSLLVDKNFVQFFIAFVKA